MIIIGLVGMQKSGKGIISDALNLDGWTQISMSSMLRGKALYHKPDLIINRDIMRKRGIRYRRKHGGGYLADLCFEYIETLPPQMRQKVIIDGIRHPDEIETILSHNPASSYFWGVIASEDATEDQKIRFGRLESNPNQRGDHFESGIWEDFVRSDAQEWDNSRRSRFGTQIGKCLERVSELQREGKGRIIINGADTDKEVLGEVIREYARELEGVARHPERYR